MGEKPISRPITINFKISKVIDYPCKYSGKRNKVHSKKHKSYFYNAKYKRVMD